MKLQKTEYDSFEELLNEFPKMNQKEMSQMKIQFKCLNCEKDCEKSLYALKKRFFLKCAHCIMEESSLKKYGVSWPSASKEVQNKIKENNLKKYGVQSTSQLQSVKEKQKQTCLKKYGTEFSLQNEEVKIKGKETCLRKYGVEFFLQSDEMKKAQKDFCERNGAKSISDIPFVKEKKSQTYLMNFGTNCIFSAEKIKDKIKETNLQRRGVEHYVQSEEFKEKQKQNNLRKYGFEYYFQTEEFKKQFHKKYEYDGIQFDSSWELALWIYAKDHNEHIEREPVSFEFIFKNKTYRCFPDFLYQGQLIEIKGDHFFKNGKMICPFDESKNEIYETKHLCEIQNGVQFWSKKEMIHYLEYVEKTYGKDFLKSFKKKD